MQRLLRLTATALKSSLNVLLAPAEDPRQTYADPGQRQRDLLAQVQQALAANAALQARLEGRSAQLRERLSRLDAQARQALGAGREDLARLALEREQATEVEAKAIQRQAQQIALEGQRLALVEQRLAAQIEAYRARQEVITARYDTAESQVRLGEALNGLSEELADLGLELEAAEQRAEAMRARALALDDLVEAGVLDEPDPAARRLSDFDLAQAVEARLAALRRSCAR